jgi:hypothetical protein
MTSVKLNWKKSFMYDNMVKINTPADGSCFFHAIAYACFIPYKTEKIDGIALNKSEFIKTLRKRLAEELSTKIDDNTTHYDSLSRGQLGVFSEGVEKYSLENMKKELKSNGPVDNVYNEFISNILNKDIYILSSQTQDVYVTGNDFDILYKGRESIVLLFSPGHYDLIGLQEKDGIVTSFSPDHEFILAIRKRYLDLLKIY